jgi:coenzyme F420-0:L-glutamate ligase/coenzyme F420-1:gamma-L-glutamate ligase
MPDADGRVMHSTVIAVADELASAADLAGGKAARRPVVLVRGYSHDGGDGAAAELVMDRQLDLFP